MRLALSVFVLNLVFVVTHAQAQTWQTDGNLKYRLVNTAYPSSSALRAVFGDNATDHSASARVNLRANFNKWSAQGSYLVTGVYGDTLKFADRNSENVLATSSVQTDENRLFDLTSVIGDSDGQALLHRLDRLALNYRGEKNVIKIGRQAVSWGNGLIYSPMDFLNPFDPTAIDTEYKAGDDMIYAQHLIDNGDDLQMVWVARRNEHRRTSSEVNSTAIKYHGFVGSSEFDLLLAEHYQDTIIGLGGSVSVGGSVIRGDWVMTNTDHERFNSIVANISYSWTSWNKNISGSLEYFHNDLGLHDSELTVANLVNKPALLNRLQRRELYTLGRDYLAGSAMVEMTPLWQLTPTVFYSLSDNSALAQVTSHHSLSQDMQLVMALSAPVGPTGSEFGGLAISESGPQSDEVFNESSWSLYAQLAWYF